MQKRNHVYSIYEYNLLIFLCLPAESNGEHEWTTRCTLESVRPLVAMATLRVSFKVTGGNLKVLCEEGATFWEIVRLKTSDINSTKS